MKKLSSLLIIVLITGFFKSQAQNTPLEFVENHGQWSGAFLYKSSSNKGDVFVEQNGFTYLLGKSDNLAMIDDYHHGKMKTPPVLKFHAYKMGFENANPNAMIEGGKKQKHYYNYFLGNNPAQWQSGIHPYLALDYKNLYKGIDLHVASDAGNLKYDFMVQPMADAGSILLKFDGTDGLSLKDNNLIISTSIGDVLEMKPLALQYGDDGRKEIPCNYILEGNKVSFSFPKGYDKTKLLIIDPIVVFATFTGSTADNWGFTATYDNQGNFYSGGLVSGAGYPLSLGAIQTTYGGGTNASGSQYPCDMAITKFNANGNALIFSTYLGGSDNDQPHSLIVDTSNNLIIAGRTYSSNFPMAANAYDNSYNGAGDIVVAKLNATGTALLASTYMGGSAGDGINYDAIEFNFGELKHNYGDDARSEVLVDKSGNVYVAASTFSSNFPVTISAYQSVLNNNSQDGIVFKLNSGLSNLIYSTYLGGSNSDAAYVMTLDTGQTHFFVAGGTRSTNFPSTGGSLWPSYQGGYSDGYIAKFLNSGNYALQKTTFIGKSDYDQCFGLQVDYNNNIYVMGQTLGGTFPVSAGVYSNTGSSQFVMKLDNNLTTNLLSTVYGSGNSAATNISPVAFLVDMCENVYISGWGGNITNPQPLPPGTTTVTGMPVTANAFQSTTDGSDFYFIVFKKDFQNLLYGTFAGSNGGVCEHVDGGTSRFDKSGVVYQAICGGCSGGTFPTTAGSWSPTNASTNCNLVALKIAFQLGNPSAMAIAGPDTSGCPPLTVNFTNNSTNAVGYVWNFGDGSPTTTNSSPTHTYTNTGTFTVSLIASNPNGCNQSTDTTYFTINVNSNGMNADFNYVVTDSCNPYKATFTNNSLFSTTPGSSSFTKFVWDFGDGSTFNGNNPGSHSFPDTGCYTVRLFMYDTTACVPVDTATKIVCIKGIKIKAAFNAPDSICLGQAALIFNNSVFPQTISWNLGDGHTTTTTSPIYTFTNIGTYTITLLITNAGSCNKIDSAKKTIKVLPVPTADFSFLPTVPETNKPISFTNLSVNATSYYWAFGDGATSIEENPVHMFNKTGTFTVCLEAKSSSGCVDTVCKTVSADVRPAIGVPTAFSPNNDGTNDILFVRGAAVKSVDFKVYNRFGEMVFETTSMDIGWDGTYKGRPQEMEAYAWTLDATFIDDTSVKQKGNVTLLR